MRSRFLIGLAGPLWTLALCPPALTVLSLWPPCLFGLSATCLGPLLTPCFQGSPRESEKLHVLGDSLGNMGACSLGFGDSAKAPMYRVSCTLINYRSTNALLEANENEMALKQLQSACVRSNFKGIHFL